MNRTTNYKLCQWEAEDKVRRTDFNEDNAKIDAAIKAVANRVTVTESFDSNHTVFGSFEGDETKNRKIPLPWPPKLVILFGKGAGNNSICIVFGSICGFVTPHSVNFSEDTVKISGSSFVIADTSFNDGPTHYFAMR